MTQPVRPKFGVVVLTMGKRPDDLDRGLVSLLNQRDVDLDVVVVGNGWRPQVDWDVSLTRVLDDARARAARIQA